MIGGEVLGLLLSYHEISKSGDGRVDAVTCKSIEGRVKH